MLKVNRGGNIRRTPPPGPSGVNQNGFSGGAICSSLHYSHHHARGTCSSHPVNLSGTSTQAHNPKYHVGFLKVELAMWKVWKATIYIIN